MREWLTYELSDFLLFSEHVYWRLFVLENEALWPLPLVAPIVILASLAIYHRHPGTGLRLISAFLAIAWLSIGWNFIWLRYAPVNWAIIYFAPMFVLQAVLLAGFALDHQTGAKPGTVSKLTGYGLLASGAVVYPWLSVLDHRPLGSAEVFGVAPDPTAVASLGISFLIQTNLKNRAVAILSMIWLAHSRGSRYRLDANHSDGGLELSGSCLREFTGNVAAKTSGSDDKLCQVVCRIWPINYGNRFPGLNGRSE